MGVVLRLFIRLPTHGVAPVTHHLHLARPSQQEQIAVCTIAAITYLHMQTPAHEVGQKSPQHSSTRIIMHIGYHCLAVALIEAYSVIIVIIEEWAL
jgi:hypothetical protein